MSLQGRYKHLMCFIGPRSTELQEWIRGLPDIVYHDTSIESLSYEERRELYLNSMFAWGHDWNSVMEGMAFGCIVLSNNRDHSSQTGGIVEYIGSHEEFIERMGELVWNPELVYVKRNAGHTWCKDRGIF